MREQSQQVEPGCRRRCRSCVIIIVMQRRRQRKKEREGHLRCMWEMNPAILNIFVDENQKHKRSTKERWLLNSRVGWRCKDSTTSCFKGLVDDASIFSTEEVIMIILRFLIISLCSRSTSYSWIFNWNLNINSSISHRGSLSLSDFCSYSSSLSSINCAITPSRQPFWRWS